METNPLKPEIKDTKMEHDAVPQIPSFTCRSCLKPTKSAYPIFQASPGLKIAIMKMLRTCSLEIEEFDMFPDTMCVPCVEKLQAMTKFVTLFKKSQQSLLKQYNVEIIKIETPDSPDIDKNTIGKVFVANIQNVMAPSEAQAVSVSSDDLEATIRCCPLCPRLFKGQSLFRTHIIRHRKPIQCRSCEEYYENPLSYLKHLDLQAVCYRSTKSPITSSQLNEIEPQLNDKTGILDEAPPLVETTSLHACPFCGKEYMKFALLGRHLIAIHNSREINCQKCDVRCESGEDYVKHYNGAHKFSCKYCKKHFVKEISLERHLKTVHRTKMGECHSCPIDDCRKMFDSRWMLRKHLNSEHKKNGAFLCTDCGAAFNSADTLSYHNKKHRGRKHLCVYCGKVFWQAIHLRYHSWRHTGVKPYNCDKCDRGFISKRLLTGHQKRLECERIILANLEAMEQDDEEGERGEKVEEEEEVEFEEEEVEYEMVIKDDEYIMVKEDEEYEIIEEEVEG